MARARAELAGRGRVSGERVSQPLGAEALPQLLAAAPRDDEPQLVGRRAVDERDEVVPPATSRVRREEPDEVDPSEAAEPRRLTSGLRPRVVTDRRPHRGTVGQDVAPVRVGDGHRGDQQVEALTAGDLDLGRAHALRVRRSGGGGRRVRERLGRPCRTGCYLRVRSGIWTASMFIAVVEPEADPPNVTALTGSWVWPGVSQENTSPS